MPARSSVAGAERNGLGVRHRDRKQRSNNGRSGTHYILTIPAHQDTPPRHTPLYIKVTHAPYTNLTNGNIILDCKRVLRKRYGFAPAIGQNINAATIPRDRCNRTDVLQRSFDAAAVMARALALAAVIARHSPAVRAFVVVLGAA